MKDAGWNPELSNEEAILLATPAPAANPLPWIAAAVASFVVVVGAGWVLTRLRGSRRASRPTRG